MTTDTTSKPSLTRNAETKRRLKLLRGRPVTGESCEVPGCEDAKLEGLDCCYSHSLHDAHNTAPTSIPNDGIIDWVAIDLAVQGARPVRLTRVEKDIAVAKLLKQGMTPTAVCDRLGISHGSLNTSGWRAREVARMMEALPDAA